MNKRRVGVSIVKEKKSLLVAVLASVAFMVVVITTTIHAKKDSVWATGNHCETEFSVGQDIPVGDYKIDYIRGSGYLNITKNGETVCYSNMGPERLLPDHMEISLCEGDHLFVSEDLKLSIKKQIDEN